MLNVQDFFGEEALAIFKQGKREALREGFEVFGVRHMVLGVMLSGRGGDALRDHLDVLRDEEVTQPPESTEGLQLQTSAGTAQILQAAIGFALKGGLREIGADHLLAACLAYDDTTPPDDVVPRLRAAGVDLSGILGTLAADMQPAPGQGLVAPELEQAVAAASGFHAPADVALFAALCAHPVLVTVGLMPETVLEAVPPDAPSPSLEELIQGAALRAVSAGDVRITPVVLLEALLGDPTPNIEHVMAAHGLTAAEVVARLEDDQ